MAARSEALQTRDLYEPGVWRSRISGAPFRFASRCTASGTRASCVRLLRGGSFGQALSHQPFLDHLGHLGIVLVLHQHVRVALEADVREVDPIDRAASGLDGVAVFGVDALEGG